MAQTGLLTIVVSLSLNSQSTFFLSVHSFCQKLIANGSGQQWMLIAERCQQEFVSIACDRQGTRTLQTLIRCCSAESMHRNCVLRSLQNHVASIVCNPNGTHVAQLVLSLYPEPELGFLFDAMLPNIPRFASDPHGCVVLKQCVRNTHRRFISRYFYFNLTVLLTHISMSTVFWFVTDFYRRPA